MKKMALMITILTMALIMTVSFSTNVQSAKAQDNYTIEQLDHAVSVMSNGYVLMNDTIRISGQAPNTFLFGLPYRFGSYVVWYDAYDANATSSTFPVTTNQPFENRSGFYSLEVAFPSGMPQNLSIQVLFSNRLVIQDSQNASVYTLIFPGFPSLTTQAGVCNSSIILPQTATYFGGTINKTSYAQENLPSFTYNVSTVAFLTSDDSMSVFDVDEINRQVAVNERGELTASDFYSITNKASSTLTSIQVLLPPSASGVSAQDQLGRTMAQPTLLIPNGARYDINLTGAAARPLNYNQTTQFTVTYGLPRDAYVSRDGSNGYSLNMSLFRDIDYYVNSTSVTFVLPEGADLGSSGGSLPGVSYSITKDIFTEKISLNKDGVISLTGFVFSMTYEYNMFWSAFRPTTWAMILSLLGCLAVVIIRRPQAPTPVSGPTAATRLRPEYLRSFLDSYEEKRRIMADIDSLEERARKGRIPRQRYKIQRRTFDTRLETLSRTLDDYKEKMRATGGHYGSLMRELEVAEIELNEVETNLRSIETRHSRGELSLEGYKKLLGDYQRRKEKTQTNIDGILLRLREETQ